LPILDILVIFSFNLCGKIIAQAEMLLKLIILKEDVLIVVLAVVNQLSRILLEIVLLALSHMPRKSHRWHHMTLVEWALHFGIVKSSH